MVCNFKTASIKYQGDTKTNNGVNILVKLFQIDFMTYPNQFIIVFLF